MKVFKKIKKKPSKKPQATDDTCLESKRTNAISTSPNSNIQTKRCRVKAKEELVQSKKNKEIADKEVITSKTSKMIKKRNTIVSLSRKTHTVNRQKIRSTDTLSIVKLGRKSEKARSLEDASMRVVSGVMIKNEREKDQNNSKIDLINGFESRNNLVKLLTNEPSYRVQVFSLEYIDVFENFLKSNHIVYRKETSGFLNLNKKHIYLLEDDCSASSKQSNLNSKIFNDVRYDSCRIILYSNNPNFSFIPYKFILSAAEKQALLSSNECLLSNKNASLTFLRVSCPDPFEFTANALNYVQSLIIFALTRETKFSKICTEVQSIDPKVNNSFLVQSELNWLTERKFCKKSGDLYKIAITDLTVRKICEKLGFKNLEM